jgi:hypothetical protein
MSTIVLPTPGDVTQANTWGTLLIAWLQATIGHITNVKTNPYNAAGDGTTDDTAAIQAAIIGGAGGTVYFPAGTYKITAHLHISASHTRLEFAHGAKIQIGAAANCDGFIIDNGLHEISFVGMEFDGNQANQSSGTCKAIQGANDLTDFLEFNCYFHDLYGVSSYCNYFYGSGYERFRFVNNRVGAKGRTFAVCIGMNDLLIDGLLAVQGRGNIQWGGGARCKITNVIQYAPSHDAVSGEQQMIVIAGDASGDKYKTDTTDWEVSNCSLINGYGDCLWIGPSSRGRVVGCRIRTEGDVTSADCGASLNGADNVTYIGCEISYAGSAGIAVDRSPDMLNLTDVVFTSGTTVTSATGGFTTDMVGTYLYVTSGTHFTPGWYKIATRVSTNEITLDSAPASENTSGHADAVVAVADGSHEISIIGCQIHHCGTRSDIAGYKSGILIFPLSDNVLIDGCQIYSNTEYPVYNADGSYVTGIIIRNMESWSNGTSNSPAITGTVGKTWAVGDSMTYGGLISYGPYAEGTSTGPQTFIDNDGSGAGRLVVKGLNATTVGTFTGHIMETDGGSDYTFLDVSNVGVATLPRGAVVGADGTLQGSIILWDGPGGNTPAYIKIHSPNGTAWYLFVEDDGTIKVHNAAPTANGNGSVVGAQT